MVSSGFTQLLRRGSVSRWLIVLMAGLMIATLLTTGLLITGRLRQAHAAGEQVNVWLTTTDQANKLTQQGSVNFSGGAASNSPTINVDENTTYQTMQGFGASFNGSSVWELENKLNQTQRNALMTNLFDPTNGIGMNLLRQPVEGSDQNAPGQTAPGSACSYDDNGGVADPNLTNFSINYDVTTGRIALIQQAQSLNSQLKVMSSTWCVPQWMIQSSGGINNASTLNPQYYQTYANYLTKFVQAYGAQGIPIYALTPQNEPTGTNFNDSITADQEASLIANNLGPTFASNTIGTKILGYDQDQACCYAETLLGSAANAYLYGIAWHGYNGGNPAEMSNVHYAYPNKVTWFTEDSPPTSNTNWTQYMPVVSQRSISFLRNWSQVYIQWTMASNPQFGPGSCTNCGAMVYIDDTTGAITYSLDYYIMGHYAKFVKVGAARIGATDTSGSGLYNVAFKNPDGSKALIAYNNNASAQTFGVNWGIEHFTYTLPSQGFATFTWSGSQAGLTNGLLSRTGWTASASSGSGSDAPVNAIDGNIGSRWSSDGGQSNGMYFQVDLGSAQTFNEATLDVGSNTYDYPQGYQVYVSQDGANFGSPVASGAGASSVTDITFPSQTARYIRIVQTGSGGAWWSIAEFNLYNRGSVPVAGQLYTLTVASSGKCLDNGGTTTVGAATTQWACIGGNTNQQWTLVAQGAGEYQLVNKTSGQCLDNGGETGDGDQAHQWTCYSNFTNQEWKLVSQGAGEYQLVNATSNKCLDNSGSTSDGTIMKQWTCYNNLTNQEWAFS